MDILSFLFVIQDGIIVAPTFNLFLVQVLLILGVNSFVRAYQYTHNRPYRLKTTGHLAAESLGLSLVAGSIATGITWLAIATWPIVPFILVGLLVFSSIALGFTKLGTKLGQKDV